jgi:hypothetical protein
MNSMSLMVALYDEPDEARHAEIYECLRLNLEVFDLVWCFLEDTGARARFAPLLESLHAEPVELGKRLTFARAFGHAGAGYNVLANNDIAFGPDLPAKLARFGEPLEYSSSSKEFWCVSRHESNGRIVPFPEHSQDAWIWHGAARVPLILNTAFYLGQLGCDNRVAFEAKAAGYLLRNPGERIRIEHHHASQVRRTTGRLTGGYEYVPLERL